MSIDRRKFILGTVAAVVATQIPSVSEAVVNIEAVSKPIVPVKQSLLFHESTNQIGFMLKSSYYDEVEIEKSDFPKMALKIEKHTSDNRFNFNDADELDKYYFDNCNIREVDNFLTKEMMKQNLFEVERAANQVAKDTRIGKANNIILGEKNANYFKEFTDINNGMLFDRIKVHVRSWVKDNEILVFYKGASNFDVPGLVFEDGGIALNQDFKYTQKMIFKV